MLPKLHARGCWLAILISVAGLLASCSSSRSSVSEAPPAPPLTSSNQPASTSTLPPPDVAQVEAAVKRVFKDSVVIENSRRPSFVVGDFNRDQSQDLAVVLKPVPAKISDLNEEFPSWIFRDLNEPESKVPRLQVAAEDTLLAVIHGYGENGWRDSQATQTYLLKNATGASLAAVPAKDSQRLTTTEKKPTVRGDVVAQVLDGRSGYLYFSNFTYAWYDPKTFKGEPEPRRGHGRR